MAMPPYRFSCAGSRYRRVPNFVAPAQPPFRVCGARAPPVASVPVASARRRHACAAMRPRRGCPAGESDRRACRRTRRNRRARSGRPSAGCRRGRSRGCRRGRRCRAGPACPVSTWPRMSPRPPPLLLRRSAASTAGLAAEHLAENVAEAAALPTAAATLEAAFRTAASSISSRNEPPAISCPLAGRRTRRREFDQQSKSDRPPR